MQYLMVSLLRALHEESEREELILHFVFEIELLGGIEGTLYADKLSVRMGHEVIYGLIIED